MQTEIRWIAVDWGSTHLRTYAMGRNNQLLQTKTSANGMGSLVTGEFEPALLDLIDEWLPPINITDLTEFNKANARISVVACGMVGARQGWQEAAYQQTPCYPISAPDCIEVATQDQRITVKILPGVSQSSPADIMRGEETQIAGLLAGSFTKNADSSTICLPGTHSKWVALKGGKIEHFATYMTGETFSLLSQQSMLRHTVDLKDQSEDWDNDAFIAGVATSMENPQDLLSNCFRLRARDLLCGLSAASARANLSGLIIGSELASAQPFFAGQTVALIGEPELSKYYAQALGSLGITSHIHDPKQLTLQGLTQAHQTLSTQ